MVVVAEEVWKRMLKSCPMMMTQLRSEAMKECEKNGMKYQVLRPPALSHYIGKSLEKHEGGAQHFATVFSVFSVRSTVSRGVSSPSGCGLTLFSRT